MAKSKKISRIRPTIRDVAAEAGVSISSVSRALNGGPHLTSELHARVMRVVDRMGFEPSSAAQAMRSRATKAIGCLVSDITNPLYGELIDGAEKELQRAGYVLMLGVSRLEEERETAFISTVRRQRMDGLLLFAGNSAHDTFAAVLADLRLPCVAIDREVSGAPTVRADHRGGGYEITRYLIGLGHRRIVLLTGPPNLAPSQERVAGYMQAHREAGLNVDPALVRPQARGSSVAFSDVCQLLRAADRPTAMITMGTHMLAGVLDALTSSGMQYPRDISLICVGDTDLARHATPSISSLSWNLEEMGRVAACMLLDRLQDQHPAATPTTVYLPTKFTIRHSCARHDPDQS